jgi:hypothetical protein
MAIMQGCTLFIAWSNEEAAGYLERLRWNEHKTAETIREQVDTSYTGRVYHSHQWIRGVDERPTDLHTRHQQDGRVDTHGHLWRTYSPHP